MKIILFAVLTSLSQDQAAIDAAIEKGIAWLRAKRVAEHTQSWLNGDKIAMRHAELVAFTYAHCGVPENEPDFQELLNDMMERKVETTYGATLQAMTLEELDRVKHQRRIWQCAQFLVDNQTPKGKWWYGAPSPAAENAPEEKSVKSGGSGARQFPVPGPGVNLKPPVRQRLRVEPSREGAGEGDNSNSQYAALGLRACHDAGIAFPLRVIDKAIESWRESQKNEPGVRPEDLIEGDALPKGVGSSVARRRAEPQGWCYGDRSGDPHGHHPAYGSMTAGAVGALAIYDYIKDSDDGRKKSWKKDKDVHEGLVWLARNFSVTCNPGKYEHGGAENTQESYFYYMYALERAGMLYGTELMGTHAWYAEGAKELLARQHPQYGSWGDGTVDTCFALLFLRRATRPLDVATKSARDGR